MIYINRIYNYLEEDKNTDNERVFNIEIDSLKSVDDIKEFLKLSKVQVQFHNESMITDKNKHLITVYEYDNER